MTDGGALKLALEIDREGDSISGRLCRVDDAAWDLEQQDVWRFTGWMELTRALHEAQATDPGSGLREADSIDW